MTEESSVSSSFLTESISVIQNPEVTIQIDQPDPILPNGKISGSVTLVVNSEKITRGVVIHCNGELEVTIARPASGLTKKNKVHPMEEFRSTEIFADSWRYFLGKPGIREYKLTPGTQTMPFSFTLPAKLATSYTGSNGRVEYRIEVKVKGFGEEVKDQITTAIFLVDVPVNLNHFPDAWRPKSIAAKQNKTVLGIYRGLVGFVLEAKHGGVLAGQNLDFIGEIANTTNDWKVEGMEVRLFQSDLFAAGGEKIWTKKCIWEGKYPGVGCGRIENWRGTIGPIPDGPCTNLGSAHLIRISYWIQVCMLYRKPRDKAERTLIEVGEIVFGKIPFDSELMTKYHQENEKLRQKQILRTGVRYRASLDQVLGEKPTISYFVNYSEQISQQYGPESDSSDED